MSRRHTFAAALLSLVFVSEPMAQSEQHDLALVLAIDCSFSVDHGEFRLQMEGLGKALQHPSVIAAIKQGPNQRIAILAMQWSDNDNQKVVLPWTSISSTEEAIGVGQALQATPRQLAEGGTSIGNALSAANAALASAPSADRKVIDVSTDGRNNMGPALGPVRDQIVLGGVTINALAITNEVPTLHIYAEKQIAGGDGNFVIKANRYEEYGAAILKKLVKEIMGPGTT
jgi:hypothetical protein